MAVFPAASESFSKANLNCGIEDNLARCRDIASAAGSLSIPVRGYTFQLILVNLYCKQWTERIFEIFGQFLLFQMFPL